MLTTHHPEHPKIGLLFEEVQEQFGYAKAEIIAPCNERHMVIARDYFVVRARELGLSYPQIGRALNRHHTTIIHSFRKRERQAA